VVRSRERIETAIAKAKKEIETVGVGNG
jgi:hypothetical protein